MDFRKNEKSNLEDKKGVFFLVGMLFILSVSYAVVNLKSYAKSAYDFEMSVDDSFEELPPITTPPPPELKPPPPPPAPKPITPEIELVEDEVITEEPDFNDDNIEEIEIDDVPRNDGPDEVLDDTPMMYVSNMPYFPECGQLNSNDERNACTQKLIHNYIQENYITPDIVVEMGQGGTIYLQFVVSKQGTIRDVKVLKGFNDVADREAIRVAKTLPKFIPGKNLDRPATVQYLIPLEVSTE